MDRPPGGQQCDGALSDQTRCQRVAHCAASPAARARIGWSAELKRRSTRQIGQLIAEMRDTGKLAKGTRGRIEAITDGSAADPPGMTLAAQGVDKHLYTLSLVKPARIQPTRTPAR